MPDIAASSNHSVNSGLHPTRIDLSVIAWFVLFVLIGIVAILYPILALGCLAAVAGLGLCRVIVTYVRRANLELWQVLVLFGLSGYLLLTRGFENLTLHVGGFP